VFTGVRGGFDAAAKEVGLPGHSSAAMTMDVYGHLFTDRLDEVADALDNARAAAAKAAHEAASAVATAQSVAKVLPNAEVVDLAAYKAKGETAGQDIFSESAPGRIRTFAPASGGRCSIP
jgi:membrane protein involved in colicin uptake